MHGDRLFSLANAATINLRTLLDPTTHRWPWSWSHSRAAWRSAFHLEPLLALEAGNPMRTRRIRALDELEVTSTIRRPGFLRRNIQGTDNVPAGLETRSHKPQHSQRRWEVAVCTPCSGSNNIHMLCTAGHASKRCTRPTLFLQSIAFAVVHKRCCLPSHLRPLPGPHSATHATRVLLRAAR